MNKIDRLDRAILFEFDNNCRVSLSALARRLHQSRERIEYRVERLMDLGVIKRFYAVVNPYRLGKIVFRVALNLKNNQELLRSLDKELEAMPTTFWISKCSGRWDRRFSIFADSPLAFYSTLSSLVSRFHSIVIDYEIGTLVNIWLGFRHWLKVRSGTGSIFYGGALGSCSIDELDNSIILELIRNARATNVELGERTGAAPGVVADRIAGLEKSGIVAGFRAELDLERLQMLAFRVQLHLAIMTIETEAKLRDYCIGHPNIVGYAQQIATCPVELEVEAESYHGYLAIIDQLLKRFSDIINVADTLFVSHSSASRTCNFLSSGA